MKGKLENMVCFFRKIFFIVPMRCFPTLLEQDIERQQVTEKLEPKYLVVLKISSEQGILLVLTMITSH